MSFGIMQQVENRELKIWEKTNGSAILSWKWIMLDKLCGSNWATIISNENINESGVPFEFK